MGIVHACHVIHGLGSGGAENVLVELARVSADAGLELSVLALMDVTDARHAGELRALGVPVHSLALPSVWDPRAFGRASSIIRDLGPDIVHSHMKHADLVGAVVARRMHVPWISTLHVIEDDVRGVAMGKRWVAGQVRRRLAARTVAVSDAQRSWYLGTFPADATRVVTVHNGVVAGPRLDAEARSCLRESLGVTADEVMVLAVAVMRPGKGLDDLLRSVPQISASRRVHVVLAGDGPERQMLEELARSEGAGGSRVSFVGYRSDVSDLMNAADICVHPSHADALPTVLMQALAAGLPVVASDVGGIPEIIGDQAGVLIRPGRPAELAHELDALASDPARRAAMGDTGRQRFAARFEAHVWAGRLRALYEEVVREA